MNKEFRINIFFIGGTTFNTTVPEKEKNKIIECLNDKKISKINFGPDENNAYYYVDLDNVNIIKIEEIK